MLNPFKINLKMYKLNLEGHISRDHLSISGNYTECIISTSTINNPFQKSWMER